MKENIKQNESSKSKYPVRMICSFCKKDIGEASFMLDEPGMESHSICFDCSKKFDQDLKNRFESDNTKK